MGVGLVCLLAPIVFAACSSSGSASRYPAVATGVAHKQEKGTVVEIREVVIDGQATNIGTIVGGGIGGAVGSIATPVTSKTRITETGISTRSNSNENRAATGIGAAVGVVVGRQVEKRLTAKKVQELTIEMDGGETVIIVQERREPWFDSGDRVQVYTTRAGNSRVFHLDEDPALSLESSVYSVDDAVDATTNKTPVSW